MWVTTPFLQKDIAPTPHPNLMLNNSQPGLYKGPLLGSKWTDSGSKAAFSPPGPWAQTTEKVPSQGVSSFPGSEWQRRSGLIILLEEPTLQSPARNFASHPRGHSCLAITLMTLPPSTLELLCQRCPQSAWFFSTLSVFYLI